MGSARGLGSLAPLIICRFISSIKVLFLAKPKMRRTLLLASAKSLSIFVSLIVGLPALVEEALDLGLAVVVVEESPKISY